MMPTIPPRKKRMFYMTAGVIGLLLLPGLIGPCLPTADINEELARTSRTAIETAREAQRANDSAYLVPGRMRLLAVALGVGLPIAAAVVILLLVSRRRPDETEVGAWVVQNAHRLEGPSQQLLGTERKAALLARPEPSVLSTADDGSRDDEVTIEE